MEYRKYNLYLVKLYFTRVILNIKLKINSIFRNLIYFYRVLNNKRN